MSTNFNFNDPRWSHQVQLLKGMGWNDGEIAAQIIGEFQQQQQQQQQQPQYNQSVFQPQSQYSQLSHVQYNNSNSQNWNACRWIINNSNGYSMDWLLQQNDTILHKIINDINKYQRATDLQTQYRNIPMTNTKMDNKRHNKPIKWPCGNCSFLNDQTLNSCQMCNQSRSNSNETNKNNNNNNKKPQKVISKNIQNALAKPTVIEKKEEEKDNISPQSTTSSNGSVQSAVDLYEIRVKKGYSCCHKDCIHKDVYFKTKKEATEHHQQNHKGDQYALYSPRRNAVITGLYAFSSAPKQK